jgi:hypothetical protein
MYKVHPSGNHQCTDITCGKRVLLRRKKRTTCWKMKTAALLNMFSLKAFSNLRLGGLYLALKAMREQFLPLDQQVLQVHQVLQAQMETQWRALWDLQERPVQALVSQALRACLVHPEVL